MYYELLRNELKEYFANKKETTRFYIENGFCESWSDEHKKSSDAGLEKYLTDLRLDQYKKGIITREKAIIYAVKRANNGIEKEYNKYLLRLEAVEDAAELDYITINVEFKKSRTWGYCPSVESISNNGIYSGYASGCGYDKESSAVAQAFNQDNSILKVLYDIKEKALKEGITDYSKTTCTNVDNRNIIGYGSGYFVTPYFEGGVGVNCFWDILKKAGYEIQCNYGKHENIYRISKKAGV